MTCRFCACALDEAIEVRLRLIQKAASDKASEEAEFDAMHRQTMQDPEWA